MSMPYARILLCAALVPGACSTVSTTPPANAEASATQPTLTSPLAELPPGGADTAEADTWRAEALLIGMGERKIHVGFELEGETIQLVAYEGESKQAIAPVADVPECEDATDVDEAQHDLSLAHSALGYTVQSECVHSDEENFLSETHEEECSLEFEDGPLPQLLVTCSASYFGGAHPDYYSVIKRYFVHDFSPLPKCEDEMLWESPALAKPLTKAMAAAGCPAQDYGGDLYCIGFVPTGKEHATIITSFYLARIERSSDCDQLEVHTVVPRSLLPEAVTKPWELGETPLPRLLREPGSAAPPVPAP